MTENEISKVLVSIFIKVHSKLGTGLLESVYEAAICYELTKAGLKFHRQAGIEVWYEEITLELGFRADIIVEDKVIIEIKSVEMISPVYFKTLLTYLRLSNKKLGLLVNFSVPMIREGIHRIVNNL